MEKKRKTKPYRPTVEFLRQLNLNENETAVVKEQDVKLNSELIPGVYCIRHGKFHHYRDSLWYPVSFSDP